MKRNILLPTDFSDNSWSAIVYSLKLYANNECTFYFLNAVAVKKSVLSNLSNKLLVTMQEDAQKKLLDLKALAESSNTNPNHDFQIIISSENLITAIKKAVKKWQIDLVVMGTKGSTGAKEFFYGSNTVSVVDGFKDCPVLIVPEEYDFKTPKQIAFATDYNRSFGIVEMKPLTQLADLYNSKIRIVHISEKEELDDIQEYNLMMLQGYFNHFEYSLHWMPKYDKKAIEINDFIEELDINILAMVNYKHSFIEKIINEPVIKKIGFKPIVPFLVIPE